MTTFFFSSLFQLLLLLANSQGNPNHQQSGTTATTAVRFQLNNMITTAECNILKEYNIQYGLDYHRPSFQNIVTPRRVHNLKKRTLFQNILTPITNKILAAIQQQTPTSTINLIVDEVLLVNTAVNGQAAHSDSQLLDGAPNHTPHRLYSASIGCSMTSTYEGGHLQFFSADNRIVFSEQLAVGSGMVFSSGIENIHAVSPITQGDRYQLLYWFALENVDATYLNNRKIIKNWLNTHQLNALDRFSRFEWMTHGLVDVIVTGSTLARQRLRQEHVLKRIGLSVIEQRRFIKAINVITDVCV